MIFVTDRGRLCNNILQYGHLYAWGREHCRKTMSMRFAYKYKDFHICHTRYHNFLVYVVAKYAAKLGLIPTVDFDDFKKAYSVHRMDEQDKVAAFDCGDEDLNGFILNDAPLRS